MDSLADDGWLRSLAVYIKWGDLNDVTNSDDRLTLRQYADAVFLFESCTEGDLGERAVEPVIGSTDADRGEAQQRCNLVRPRTRRGRDADRGSGIWLRCCRRWRSASRRTAEPASEEAKRLKQLEEESQRLKQIVADLALDIQMLKHVSSGNWYG